MQLLRVIRREKKSRGDNSSSPFLLLATALHPCSLNSPFSSYSQQLFCIPVPQLFLSLILTLSKCSASLFSQLLFLYFNSKQLLCILVSWTLLLSSSLSNYSASLFPQLFLSPLTLSNKSASLFPQPFFSALALSNCSASLFPQLFFSLQTLSNCNASLFPQLFFSPQTLSNCSASLLLSLNSSSLFLLSATALHPYPHLFFSLQTLSNCSLFAQLFFILLTL